MENFNELHYFVTLSKHGSFVKAAQYLDISASALSHSIKSLETRLNMRLFNRTTRSVSLTEVGEKLLADIAPHFQAISDGIGQLDALRDQPQGTIRINTSELAANWILYLKLRPFLQENPQIKVELMIENRWVDIVQQGFDMGVRLGYSVFQDMISVQISEPIRMALVASPEYLKGKSAVKNLDDLANHSLIGMRFSIDQQQDEWEFTERGKNIHYRPDARFSVNSSLRLQAAIDGLGIAWLPESVVHAEIEQGSLVELLPKLAKVYDPLYLYYPNRKGNSKAFQMVVDLLRI